MPTRRTAPFWTDQVGQKFGPGDLISIAVSEHGASGNRLGIVEQIYLDKTNGTPYTQPEKFFTDANGNEVESPVWSDAKIAFLDRNGKRIQIDYRLVHSCGVVYRQVHFLNGKLLHDSEDRPITTLTPERIVKLNLDPDSVVFGDTPGKKICGKVVPVIA